MKFQNTSCCHSKASLWTETHLPGLDTLLDDLEKPEPFLLQAEHIFLGVIGGLKWGCPLGSRVSRVGI